jgi:hypothetical protein
MQIHILVNYGTVLFLQAFVFSFRNMVSFGFDARHLTDGSVPAVQCAVCGKEEWTTFVNYLFICFITYGTFIVLQVENL